MWYLPLMLHADRIDQSTFRLPPPRPVEGTGGVIYTLVLGVPGVMDYPEYGYTKFTPPEVLQDPAWLESMVGIPVVDRDDEPHYGGQDTTTIARDSVGRTIKAWWDPDLGLPLAEAVIDVERGLAAIRGGKHWVSSAYDPELVHEVGSYEGQGYTRREVRRSAGNNVALTNRPRAGERSKLQADAQGEPMNPYLAALSAFHADYAKTHADAEGAKDPMAWAFDQLMRSSMDACMRADAAEKALADMKAKPKADADPEEMAEEEEDIAEAADAIRLADSLGVPVKGTLVELRRTLAQKLEIPGADKMAADSLGAALTVYRLAASRSKAPTAADKLLRDYEPPKPHADAQPNTPRPLSLEGA